MKHLVLTSLLLCLSSGAFAQSGEKIALQDPQVADAVERAQQRAKDFRKFREEQAAAEAENNREAHGARAYQAREEAAHEEARRQYAEAHRKSDMTDAQIALEDRKEEQLRQAEYAKQEEARRSFVAERDRKRYWVKKLSPHINEAAEYGL